MSARDGGPAFPIPGPIEGEYTRQRAYGMTLRDWFAGQAMAQLIRNGGDVTTLDRVKDRLAYEAYGYADAMLANR